MSMFPMTDYSHPGLKAWEDFAASAARSAPAALPHPAAAAMAASAIGMGLASQAVGTWFGLLAGMAEASQKSFALDFEAGHSGASRQATPAAKGRAAALTLIADVESLSRDVAEAALKQIEAVPAVATKAPVPQKPVVARAAPVAPSPAEAATVAPAAAPAPAALLPEDFRAPRKLQRPASPDDLKAIAGIGPKLEKVLNDLGIWTFAQVAGLAAAEIAWLDDYLAFRGRIDRDGWVEQAAKLVKTGRGA